MLLVSLATSLLGLTEPLFVPAYWSPPSLFNLAARTGFDIESLIFSFGIGGIAAVFYNRIFNVSENRVFSHEHRSSRHRYHLIAILSAPVILAILLLATPLNPLHSAIIAMIAGGVATWYCRPDLKKKMLVSAFIFLGIYFVYFFNIIRYVSWLCGASMEFKSYFGNSGMGRSLRRTFIRGQLRFYLVECI